MGLFFSPLSPFSFSGLFALLGGAVRCEATSRKSLSSLLDDVSPASSPLVDGSRGFAPDLDSLEEQLEFIRKRGQRQRK